MNNPDTSHVPAQEWEAMLTPESIGWSGTWLHQVQDYTQETGSFAGLLVSHGK